MRRSALRWLARGQLAWLRPKVRVAIAALALGGGAPGCLLEQDLGHDEPQVTMDLAVEVDLTSPPPDLTILPDLTPRPDHALGPDLACPNEQTFCDGQCRNLNSDPLRCGTCGNHCAAGSICAMGLCVPCLKEQSVCENHCVVLTADPNNCGACGKVCDANRKCIAGVCT